MAVINYRDLVVWQKAMDLVEHVYRMTRGFPSDERFGLAMQLRRSAVSIPSNIAEGQGRGPGADFVRFLRIAYGSLREVETQIMIGHRLAYVDAEQLSHALDLCEEVGRLLNGLMNSLEP